MNRKQKVAIVVGIVVMVLLALFPPWMLCDGASDSTGWTYQHGLAWIGSPPEDPTRNPVLPMFNEFVAEQVEKLQGRMPDSAGFTEEGGKAAPLVTINWRQLIAHLVTALTLSIATVLVLKNRKA